MINYFERGDGEPLVLVHGIGSRWQIWEPVIPLLAERFRVIAVDLPGFGASPVGDEPTTVDALTDRLARFLAEQGIERPHLAGNSMGGAISLKLGSRGLARSVTAFSPIGFWSTPGVLWCQQSLRIMRGLGALLRPTLPGIARSRVGRTVLLAEFVGQPWKLDPEVALADADGLIKAPGFDQALKSFGSHRFGELGALADIPVTIAWGNRDALLTYLTQSARAKELLPGARHVTLPDCGHVPFNDDPERCAAVLLDQAGTPN